MENPPATIAAKTRMTRGKALLQGLLFQPLPIRVEIALWLVVAGVAVGIRWYLAYLMPYPFWSKDANSYAASAFEWLNTGTWESDPRRGPIYSLFIAGAIKAFGSLSGIMLLQHFLGLCAIAFTLVCARIRAGASAAIPLLLCAYAYAVYGQITYLGHLVRNETLLFFFGSFAICSWFLCLHRKAAGWLWVTGITTGLLSLVKNVFVPFPLMVLLGAAFHFRNDRRFACRQVLFFLVALSLPLVGVKWLDSLAPSKRPPAPQGGILLYGRTAQFTVLDGGIHPELKAFIRKDVENYRALPELDNNIVIYRTVIPRIREYLRPQGKDTRDVNRVCRELAVEAIRANPGAYLKQVAGDLGQLLTNVLKYSPTLSASDVKKVSKLVRSRKNSDPQLNTPNYLKALDEASTKGHFNTYARISETAWLFRFGAVFFTTFLLPVFIWRTQGTMRLWWLGLAAVWYFTLVLHSTVGRPMDRYMMPVIPIIFLTLSAAVVALWNGCRAFLESRVSTQERAGAMQPS